MNLAFHLIYINVESEFSENSFGMKFVMITARMLTQQKVKRMSVVNRSCTRSRNLSQTVTFATTEPEPNF